MRGRRARRHGGLEGGSRWKGWMGFNQLAGRGARLGSAQCGRCWAAALSALACLLHAPPCLPPRRWPHGARRDAPAPRALCCAALRCCAHPPSMGRPEPLNTRPSMSRDTGVLSTCGQHVNVRWRLLEVSGCSPLDASQAGSRWHVCLLAGSAGAALQGSAAGRLLHRRSVHRPMEHSAPALAPAIATGAPSSSTPLPPRPPARQPASQPVSGAPPP